MLSQLKKDIAVVFERTLRPGAHWKLFYCIRFSRNRHAQSCPLAAQKGI